MRTRRVRQARRSLGQRADWAMDRAAEERLRTLAEAWLQGRSPGDGMGLLRHLALRRYPSAMTELSRRAGQDGSPPAAPSTAKILAYRAFRQGDPTAAYNAAMGCFNRGDLQGYRQWLGRAARGGHEDAGRQLRRFETRLPHGAAFDIGRGRPRRAGD